jgi:FkbM family methyltransferase
MSHFFRNLLSGIRIRIQRAFYRPLAIFDISWLQEKILKHRRDQQVKHHVYQKKYTIAFRDAEEFLLSADELFVKEFYKFRAENEKPRIIDCGSYIGTSILFFKTQYPSAIVTGFEPDENNYSLLKSNLDSWNFKETDVVRAAVWVENGSIQFNSAGGMSGSVQLEESKLGAAPQNTVPCIRLKDFLTEPIDFLKLDIEGAEYAVVKDCASQLSNVRNLFVEYHGYYREMHKLNEILGILLDNGFKYYIKEGLSLHERPFLEADASGNFDLLLNIFSFR